MIRSLFRKLFALLLTLVLFAGILGYVALSQPIPQLELKDGDIVFQTVRTNQYLAIIAASGHPYTHTGIVHKTDKGLMVLETRLQATETPFEQWVQAGSLHRFAVYRYPGLKPEQAAAIIRDAESMKGIPYDFYFLPGREQLYCSELVHEAYKTAGLDIGKMEKIGSLNVNNGFVKKIIEQRWQSYKPCVEAKLDFQGCYQHLMEQELMTPVGLTYGAPLEKIYSNYVFW